jgi:hypothetical protein
MKRKLRFLALALGLILSLNGMVAVWGDSTLNAAGPYACEKLASCETPYCAGAWGFACYLDMISYDPAM